MIKFAVNVEIKIKKKKNCKGTFSGLRPEKMLFISS